MTPDSDHYNGSIVPDSVLRRAGVLPRALWEVPLRWGRCCLAAGLMSLVAMSVLIDRAEGLAGGHADRYRPGGLTVDRASRMLGQGQGQVEGCLRAGANDRSSQERAELSRLFAILSQSPTGRAALYEAARRGIQVCIDNRTQLLAYYFADLHVVGVSAELSEGGKIAFLAHELAHIPQHPAYSDNRYFPAEDLLLLRRMREAAAEAASVRIAWELRQAGYAFAWDEKLASAYRDVARVFETIAAKAADDTDMLRAMRRAFDRWFEAPWRRRVYDAMTAEHLQRISHDAMGLVPPRYALSHEFLLGIGWLDGQNFLAATAGPRLTDSFYAGGVPRQIAARIRRLTQQASRETRALELWFFPGALS